MRKLRNCKTASAQLYIVSLIFVPVVTILKYTEQWVGLFTSACSPFCMFQVKIYVCVIDGMVHICYHKAFVHPFGLPVVNQRLCVT